MTVKSMVALAPKLRPATMQHVMRAFAKLQLDEEAAIRTNTTICLGKIASHIDAGTREKVRRHAHAPAPVRPSVRHPPLTSAAHVRSPLTSVRRSRRPSVRPQVLIPACCRALTERAWFERLILGCIGVNCVLLAIEDPTRERPRAWAAGLDAGLAAVYVVELAALVHT